MNSSSWNVSATPPAVPRPVRRSSTCTKALPRDDPVRRGTRLDLNLDGRNDASGAAVMDTAWDGMAMAVISPVLGPLTDNLAKIERSSDTPDFETGWWGYVSKDLRTELG